MYASYRKAFAKALIDLGERNSNLVVIDADTPKSTGTMEFAMKFPERFINIGISEQDLVSTAAGLAIAGLTPVAAAFAIFLMRAWEQTRNTIARDRLNVKLVGTHAGLSAHYDGSSHQSLEDISLMRAIPGMTVVVPADFLATYELTIKAVEEHKGPLYMRLGRDNAPRVYSETGSLELGRVSPLVDGFDLTVIACGPSVAVALEVSRLGKQQGLGIEVLDAHTVKPLDEAGILKSVRKTGRVVTIEEHNIIGGLGSAIAELLAENYPVPLLRVGVRDSFGVSARSYEELLEFFKLTPKHVWSSIKRWLEVGLQARH
uniref:2-oxoacid oxidoreductase (ferredoxin) n=1 Tax=Fervidicoccus fontis TaxID=683846 RepID=A0A7J3ZIQ2_9CREN